MDSPLKFSIFSGQDFSSFAAMATRKNLSRMFSGQDSSSFTAMATPLNLSILTGILGSVFIIWSLLFSSKLKEIPGPRGLPILGNLFDWPSEFQAETIQEWKEKYGTMIKLKVLGKTAIFLTTGRTISELFAKRSTEFSDRPRLVFSQDIVGLSALHPMTQFGAEFKEQRKFMKEVLGGDVIRRHEALLDEEGLRLLQGIYDDPTKFDRHLRRFSSSVALRMVYGFEAMENDDPHVLLAEEMMQLSEYAVIAGWAVDFFPWLRYLPEWFPGAGFQKKGKYYKKKAHEMISGLYQEVNQQVLAGHPNNSFTANNIRRANEGLSSYGEELISHTATAMFGGSSDTTASAGWSFMLAMVLNQDAQAKAQKEIDALTGRTRLPRMTDRAALPYLSALVWEAFRWSPPVPVTLPHRARKADEFDGYRINKDDVLVASIWSISREEEYHKEADIYDPERYFDEREERTPFYVFGYGHRRCPGADMAFAQLFHEAAYLLSVFNIRPEVDSNGKPVAPRVEFVGEMVRHPKPFKCVITPRWKDAHLLFEGQTPKSTA